MILCRDAAPVDGAALSAMARQCFTDTFGTLYRAEDLAAFLDTSFGERGLAAQIGDPAYRIRIAWDGADIAGFAKVGPVLFPGDWGTGAIELHQLYVLGSWQGAGVAPLLMDWALETARAGGYQKMMLSVFIDNIRAQRFYRRYGFAEVGHYGFRVGEQVDDDRIWACAL